MVEIEKNFEKISENELLRYENLKTEIRNWWIDRLRIGLLLKEIQEKKLYRREYQTFEEFCETEFEMQRRAAYRLIEAAAVKASITNLDVAELIENDSQARALAPVPEEQREEVVKLAASNSNGNLTARAITEAAENVAQQQPDAPPVKREKPVPCDKTGYPIPEAIMEDWKKAESFQDVLTRLQQIKLGVQHALDEQELAFREITNTTVADIQNAITSLKGVIPYAVCTTCQGHTREQCTLCKGRGFISKFAYEHWIPVEVRELRERSVKR